MRVLIDRIGRVEYAEGRAFGRLLELPQDENVVDHNMSPTTCFVVE